MHFIEECEVEYEEEHEVDNKAMFTVCVRAVITIRLKNGKLSPDIGCGTKDSRKRGIALANARKSAVTDGIKRAARHFGMLFSCVYNKQYQQFIFGITEPNNNVSQLFEKDRLFSCLEVYPVNNGKGPLVAYNQSAQNSDNSHLVAYNQSARNRKWEKPTTSVKKTYAPRVM